MGLLFTEKIMKDLTLISFEPIGEGILCTFAQPIDYDNVGDYVLPWLSAHAFNCKESLTGADRISWRLEIAQQVVWLHFDELSQSCWFDQASEDLLAKLKQIVENSKNYT